MAETETNRRTSGRVNWIIVALAAVIALLILSVGLMLNGGVNDVWRSIALGAVTAEGTTQFNTETAIGALELDETLGAGGWRELTPDEVALIREKTSN